MSSLLPYIFLAGRAITWLSPPAETFPSSLLALVFYHNIPKWISIYFRSCCSAIEYWGYWHLDFCLTWTPVVTYCQTIRLKEHFNNRALVTGSGEINGESEALDFVLGFASDFQYNLVKPSFHLVLRCPLPHLWKTELEIAQRSTATLIQQWEDNIWRKT